MLFLSGAVNAVLNRSLPPMVGWMLQPAMGNHPLGGRTWAADNGVFGKGLAFDEAEWLAWLGKRRTYLDTCLFAVVPDVVADAAATLARFGRFVDAVREFGYPVAFVAQDGIEGVAVPWDGFDCLFIGGSTPFKLWGAEGVAREAKGRGKWLHMGRVNSGRRLRLAHDWGCDSVDGTFLAFGPDCNVPRLERWFDAIRVQPERLPGF